MSSDPATVNALKAQTKALDDQTRVLKEISASLKGLNKAVTALNTNAVEAIYALRPEIKETQDASGL